MKLLSAIVFSIMLLVACGDSDMAKDNNEPKRDTVDYKATIDEANSRFNAAVLKGDSAAIVSLYHPDANIYPPNMEKTDAKKMASMLSGMPGSGTTSFKVEAKEIFEGDDVVTEVGTYERGDDKKMIDKGKYIVVWKKDGDKWKLYRDIWNSDNMPMPPAKK